MAVDLGGVYEINDDWTVSASVLDLGFINWSNDMAAENRSKSFIFDGFHDVSVTSDHGEELDVKADRYGDQMADFANLTDMGDKGGRTTGIGATINLGAEYTLPVYRKVSFGALWSSRFTASMGWVLNIHPKGYNLFIGMDHILGKTSKEMIPLSSNASITLGMNIAW